MKDNELQRVIEELHKLYDKKDILEEEIEMKMLQLEQLIKEAKVEEWYNDWNTSINRNRWLSKWHVQ